VTDAPRFKVVALDLFERDVHLRLPFRFGAATINAAPQAFVRARIRADDGREATGWTAELMVPKWFDKNPQRTNVENIDDLRHALTLARDTYVSDRGSRSAFGHASLHYRTLLASGASAGLNPLIVSFGGALADRAILDAMCRLHETSFAAAIRVNLPGLDASLAPDLAHFPLDSFLAQLVPTPAIAARHTVGLLDPIRATEVGARPDDDLPVALDEVIAFYGHKHFKLKLSGNPERDVDRLARIAAVLDALPAIAVTLDGNEQFEDGDVLIRFWRELRARRDLARFAESVLYLEQPLPRKIALDADLRALAGELPLLIDESDETFDAFPRARRRGYTGVSSKNCKGPYKSLINAARCANGTPDARLFLSAEDLTAQCGLAVQQDLALASLLGVTHVERNGHHYAAGFAAQGAGLLEQATFAAAHPDLYVRDRTGVRLDIREGRIALGSLDAPGFAAAAVPEVESLRPMHRDATASSVEPRPRAAPHS